MIQQIEEQRRRQHHGSGQQHHQGGDQHRPYAERHAEHGHAGATELDDRRQVVDRPMMPEKPTMNRLKNQALCPSKTRYWMPLQV